MISDVYCMDSPTLIQSPEQHPRTRRSNPGSLKIEVARPAVKKKASRRGGRREAAYKFVMPLKGMVEGMGRENSALGPFF